MGKMKELAIKDAPRYSSRPNPDHRTIGEFTLIRWLNSNKVVIKHVSGEGGPFPIPTFEAEVCPWGELGSKANVAELVAKFYKNHF